MSRPVRELSLQVDGQLPPSSNRCGSEEWLEAITRCLCVLVSLVTMMSVPAVVWQHSATDHKPCTRTLHGVLLTKTSATATATTTTGNNKNNKEGQHQTRTCTLRNINMQQHNRQHVTTTGSISVKFPTSCRRPPRM